MLHNNSQQPKAPDLLTNIWIQKLAKDKQSSLFLPIIGEVEVRQFNLENEGKLHSLLKNIKLGSKSLQLTNNLAYLSTIGYEERQVR